MSPPILIACKESPERLPPVMSLLTTLATQKAQTVLVTTRAAPATIQSFQEMGVRIIQSEADSQYSHNSGGKISKGVTWLRFRRAFWQVREHFGKDALLWIATGDSVLALGRRLLECRFILELLELYDRNRLYLRLLAPYVRGACCVVVPEACRAAIFRVWYQLPATPFVLPNKPCIIPQQRRLDIPHEGNRREMDRVAGRKLVLYQARMVRMETFDVARALQRIDAGHVLGILGQIRDHDMFARLRQEYPDLAYFDYMPPPDHLAVTSHAHIGLLVYNYESLNNVFCAPNKTWEYASLQLPMLCNELPMLGQQLEQYHAGETFKMGNVDSITAAIEKIEADYEGYSAGARRLFDSVDLAKIVRSILEAAAR